MSTRYLEDIEPGDVSDLGSFTLSEEDIVEFSRRYDPQPMHVDPERARESTFGGLIASGWQTAASCMRLLVDGFLRETVSMGSPGLEELRWPNPVRPGHEIRVENEVLDVRVSESRDDRGYVRSRTTARDEHDDPVLTWIGTIIVGRRGDECE